MEHQKERYCHVAEKTECRWVGQQSGKDCGVAALAMITGRSYTQVRSFFPYVETDGTSFEECAAYLYLVGYSVHPQEETSAHLRGAETLSPAPFAQVHLCNVTIREDSPTRHWVVMLADGAVLDSHRSEPGQLSNYFQVHRVFGIVPNTSAPADFTGADPLTEEQGKRCYITRRVVKRSPYAVLLQERKRLRREYLSVRQYFVKHLCRWLDIDLTRVG